MSNYIKVEFEHLNIEQKDIIIALLAEMNYDGFEENDDVLKAFIPSNIYDENKLKALSKDRKVFFSVSKLENKNWNTHWETNFRRSL
jgi:ribosomal protein L11 methyltransferase